MTARRLFALLLLGSLLWVMAAAAQAQEPEQPAEIVRQTINQLFEMISAERDYYEQHPSELQEDVREVLMPHIDKIYVARLILGRSAREVNQEGLVEFADALSNLLVKEYADGLLEFETREQVELLPGAGENTERMTKVRTRVAIDSGQRTPVDYVFHQTEEGWKLFDVIVEGISYVATFRNQIGQQVREKGFESTLAKLQRGDVEVDVDGQ